MQIDLFDLYVVNWIRYLWFVQELAYVKQDAIRWKPIS